MTNKVRDIEVKYSALNVPEDQAQAFKRFLERNKVTEITLKGTSGDTHTTLFTRPCETSVRLL